MDDDEIIEYRETISPHLGKLTAYEFITYYAINKARDKTEGLKFVFQHGATANMSQYDADAIPKNNPESIFPAITNTTQIAAFSSTSDMD